MSVIARFVALAGFHTSNGTDDKYSEIVGTGGANEAEILLQVETPALGVTSHEVGFEVFERQASGAWYANPYGPLTVGVSGEAVMVVSLTGSELRVSYVITGLGAESVVGCGINISGTLRRVPS